MTQFLNAVALTPADIEIRQMLRNEFIKVGLEECFEYLKQRFPDESNQVRGQVGVYMEEAGYDVKEMADRSTGKVDLKVRVCREREGEEEEELTV